jgi:hypothetical protein
LMTTFAIWLIFKLNPVRGISSGVTPLCRYWQMIQNIELWIERKVMKILQIGRKHTQRDTERG